MALFLQGHFYNNKIRLFIQYQSIVFIIEHPA
jgi:hypothetical protein